jgi:hypothetical protein
MRKIAMAFLMIFTVNLLVAQVTRKASFSLQIGDIVIPYSVFGMFVLPNEEREIEIIFENEQQSYYLLSEAGVLDKSGENAWVWKAPREKGVYQVAAYNQSKTDSVRINFFVMIPYQQLSGSYLNGYQIGEYPLSNNTRYPLPKGFIELTAENFDVNVSPNFTLGEFMCKQKSKYPKYIVLQEKLLLKLELIIDELEEEGIDVEDMIVMSGYRTPYYNKAIGNVKYSRHVFGDAADVFIDNNNDFRMDDLNNDGVSNKKDARIIYQIIDDMKDQTWYKNFIGGLGLYGATSSHPAFVHVDGRGFLARWGL